MELPLHIEQDIKRAFPVQELARPVEFGDHEAYLNFNSDTTGLMFHQWWSDEGQQAFLDWLKTGDGQAYLEVYG